MLSSGRDCGEPATTTVLKRKSGTRQRENLEFIRVDAGPGKKTAWAVDRVGNSGDGRHVDRRRWSSFSPF